MDAADMTDKWFAMNEYDSEPDDDSATRWKLCAGCHNAYVLDCETFCTDCYSERFWPMHTELRLFTLDDAAEGDDNTCPLP